MEPCSDLYFFLSLFFPYFFPVFSSFKANNLLSAHLSIFSVNWKKVHVRTTKRKSVKSKRLCEIFLFWKRAHPFDYNRPGNAMKFFVENALHSLWSPVAIRMNGIAGGGGELNNAGEGVKGWGMIRRNRICFAQLHVSFYNIPARGAYAKRMMSLYEKGELI
jgi:hypothetical protein